MVCALAQSGGWALLVEADSAAANKTGTIKRRIRTSNLINRPEGGQAGPFANGFPLFRRISPRFITRRSSVLFYRPTEIHSTLDSPAATGG
jgi:hypothetical protein